MPFKSPIFFYGLSTEFGILTNSAEILFAEKALPCCTFKKGDGYQFSLGAHAEYWDKFNLAYTLDFSINDKYSKFLGNSDTLPIKTGESFISQYEFKSNINNILIEPGIKYRILSSHLNIGASLQLGFQYVATSEHNEYVKSPDNWPWKTRNLSSELPFDLNLFVLNPRVFVGYDYSLFDGIYLTPSLVYTFPLISVASGQYWKYQSLIFKLSLNYGGFLYID